MTETDAIDRVFHALADPTRRAIIARLCKGPATVSALAAPLDMALPSVHQHLRLLESSGLIGSKKVGRTRTCWVESAGLAKAERWIASRRSTWEKRLDRLGDFLKLNDD